MKRILFLMFIVSAFFINAQHELINSVCFNSSGNDYAVRIINGKMYFVSDVADSTGIKKKDISTGFFFTNIYEVAACEVSDAKLVKNSLGQDVTINSSWYNGPVSYSEKDSVLFFSNTSEGYEQGRMGIYLSKQLKDGSYTDPQPFPYNSIDHSCMHPFFDQQNSFLYFVSEMGKKAVDGTIDFDLYRISFDGTQFGEIDTLKNLNTSYNELFPYVINDVLYFSSNRAEGLGGLDIYKVESNGEVKGLTAPFNSEFDDFAITFTEDNRGYFSSNRAKAGKQDDIFEFYIPRIDKELIVKEDIEEIIEQLDGLLRKVDPKSADAAILRAAMNKMNAQDSLIESMHKKMYSNQEKIMNTLDESPTLSFDQKVMLYQQIVEKSEMIDEKIVTKLPKETQSLIKQIQANDKETVAIVAKEKEVLDKKLKPFIEDKESISVGEINNLITHYEIKDSEISEITTTTYPMLFYYDFDIFKLTEEQYVEIRKFVNSMKGHKGKIYIEGHTDGIGTVTYNHFLSKRRAQFIADILISEGFPKENIVVLARGKVHPAATNFSVEGRALNRRVVLRLN